MTIVGRITKDAVVNQLKDERKVVNFLLAIKETSWLIIPVSLYFFFAVSSRLRAIISNEECALNIISFMKKNLLALLMLLTSNRLFAQADNEIQVYASPTIQHKWIIFELHTNYTFRGTRYLADPSSAKWWNETLEITYGVAKKFELGFYTFSAFSPQRDFQYLGNKIRPRGTVPQNWNWPFGASLSLEFGFFRPHKDSSFNWEGEMRPIIDKTFGNLYLSLNPNIDFVLQAQKPGSALRRSLNWSIRSIKFMVLALNITVHLDRLKRFYHLISRSI